MKLPSPTYVGVVFRKMIEFRSFFTSFRSGPRLGSRWVPDQIQTRRWVCFMFQAYSGHQLAGPTDTSGPEGWQCGCLQMAACRQWMLAQSHQTRPPGKPTSCQADRHSQMFTNNPSWVAAPGVRVITVISTWLAQAVWGWTGLCIQYNTNSRSDPDHVIRSQINSRMNEHCACAFA